MSSRTARPRPIRLIVAAALLVLLGAGVVTVGLVLQTLAAAASGGAAHPSHGSRPQAVAVSEGGATPENPVSPFDDSDPSVVNLDPTLRQALQDAARKAEGEGVTLVVNSGWRTEAQQQKLLDEAVVTYGSLDEASRWVAPPRKSTHVHGEAVDVGDLQGAIWLGDNGRRFGLCQTYSNERWHFEYRAEAITGGCPRAYRDATEDPRLR